MTTNDNEARVQELRQLIEAYASMRYRSGAMNYSASDELQEEARVAVQAAYEPLDAALRSLAAQQGEVVWLPIETAPKYTPIRLYALGGGFYDEDFNPSGSVEGHWSDDIGWSGAFWDGDQDTWYRREGIVPTHWTPLPEPPESLTALEQKGPTP